MERSYHGEKEQKEKCPEASSRLADVALGPGGGGRNSNSDLRYYRSFISLPPPTPLCLSPSSIMASGYGLNGGMYLLSHPGNWDSLIIVLHHDPFLDNRADPTSPI